MPDDSDSDEDVKDKKYSLAMMEKFIKEGRAYGVFIILAIQVTTYEEMPLILRRQTNVHITFRQLDASASKVIIGTDDAVKLKDKEALILINDIQKLNVPIINENIIKNYLKKEEIIENYQNNVKINLKIKEIPEHLQVKYTKHFEGKKTIQKQEIIDYSMGYGKEEKSKNKRGVLGYVDGKR